MNPGLGAAAGLFMRWLHISSVVALIGGFIYARVAVWPALQSAGEASRALAADMLARLRPLLWTLLFTVTVSGLYNYLSKHAYPPHYHAVIGIKFLFVLHILAVTVLFTLPSAGLDKQRRWLTGLMISGLVVIAISAGLRWLSLRP